MAEPITLAQARAQCSIDDADTTFDALLTIYIAAARDWVERYTGHILMQREMTETLAGFPCSYIELPWRPVTSVEGISYTDSDNAAADFEDFTAILGREPLRIYAGPGVSWPSTYDNTGVTVTFTAGYEDAADPETGAPGLLQAMLLLIAHWFANRETVSVGQAATEVPFAVNALCNAYRVPWL